MDRSLDSALGRLRLVAAVQTLGGLSDRELLERFVGAHDESAFTVLIERHGPMVLGACRRALPNHHDAEDACQATFLVLARKADSLRKKESLGSWLHGVACRVAAGLKRGAGRRKQREQRADPPAPANPAVEATWREVQAVLDEELGRLPERYRAPLILCYLECLTRDEAAARLGLSAGSLHGRLERGRDLLRERLTQRGLTLPAVLSAAALGEGVAHALSPTLVISSAKAAALFAAGQSLTESVGANVLVLTQEVLKSMSLAKVKIGAVSVLCAAVFALAGGSFVSLGFAQDARPKPPAVVAKVESDGDFIRRISKDLRGTDPTPAEIHFFAANKEPGKRQKLIDLFIQERQAKKEAKDRRWDETRLANPGASGQGYDPAAMYRVALAQSRLVKYRARLALEQQQLARLEALQKEFYKELHAAKAQSDIARITQTYLDRLIGFLKANPKSQDAPDAIRQIVLIYESQGKKVEADAWRAQVPKEAPNVPSKSDKGK
jgi:RNA polymerase sigma factor (sigma-70 family)